MAKFKVILSDPEEKKAKAIELEGTHAAPLIGKKIDDIIDGIILGMPGYKIQITGGSDKDGVPMRPDVHGGVRRDVILSEGVGFNPQSKGERKRKKVRGNVITEDIVQINMKIVEKPKSKEAAEQEKSKES